MVASYNVPVETAEVELRFKNSRFIGLVGPAASVEEARAFIEQVKNKYPDAGHHVYAFAAGYGATVTHGMSDDGEPSGTAGRPALAVVQGAGVGDVVVVIVRYFGGTKLGTGGLVKAYTETAQAALEVVKCEEKVDLVWGRAALRYEHYEVCRLHIESCGGRIEGEDFGGEVELTLSVAAERMEELQAGIRNLTSGRVEVETISQE